MQIIDDWPPVMQLLFAVDVVISLVLCWGLWRNDRETQNGNDPRFLGKSKQSVK